MSYKTYWTGRHSAKRAADGAKRKACRCGCHNASNVKCNLHHNSTAKRLAVRKARRAS